MEDENTEVLSKVIKVSKNVQDTRRNLFSVVKLTTEKSIIVKL